MALASLFLTIALLPGLTTPQGLLDREVNVLQTYPPEVRDGTQSLYVAVMQSFSGGWVSAGGVPAIQLALDDINTNDSVLPGYTLRYELTDTECVRTPAVDQLFRQVRSNETTKIAAIGAGCGVSTESVAEISHYWQIPQISCQNGNPVLNDRDRFRAYFQTLGTNDINAYGYYNVIRMFGWRRVKILYLDHDTFEEGALRLTELLEGDGIEVKVNTFEVEEGIEGLGPDPFEDFRIFVLMMFGSSTSQLLCKAYEQDVRYPTHLLMYPAWYSEGWYNNSDGDCTVEEKEKVLPYSLGIQIFEFIEDYAAVAATGINGNEYELRYSEYYSRFISEFRDHTIPSNIYGQNCYDATWILALALDQVMRDLQNDSAVTNSLESFTYDDFIIRQKLVENLANIDFLGITGRITFEENGIRTPERLQVFQQKPNSGDTEVSFIEIAQVTANGSDWNLNYVGGADTATLWPDGVPYDGVRMERIVTIHVSVTVIFTLLATAGLIFTAVCLVFNFVFRNRKLIRLSSTNLNYIVGAGAVSLYLDICLMVAPSTDPEVVKVLCNITTWLTSLGYSLCFGTIMAKMARVYYIFNNPKPKKKGTLKDYHLAFFVLALVVVDVVILFIYTLVEWRNGTLDPIKTEHSESPSVISGATEVETLNFIYLCSSTARDITLGILYGYKAIIQAATVILALKIRKVKVRGLDDHREIIMATYLSSFLLTIVIIFTYTITNFINVFAVLSSLNLFIGATVIMALQFLPKMVALYKDPSGENVFSKTKQYASSNGLASSTEAVNQLQAKIEYLERRLSEANSHDEWSTDGVLGDRTSPTRMMCSDTMNSNDKPSTVDVPSHHPPSE